MPPYFSFGGSGIDCFEHQDQGALGYLVPGLDLEFPDSARLRRGYLQRRLVGLERDQRIVGLEGLTSLKWVVFGNGEIRT